MPPFKIIVVFLCIILIKVSGTAQGISEIEARIEVLNRLSYAVSEPNDSILYLSAELRKLSSEQSYQRGVLHAEYFIGTVLGRTERVDSSIVLLEGVLQQQAAVEEEGSTFGARVKGTLGNSYFLQGDFKRALKYYQESRDELQVNGRKKNIYILTYNIGRTHMALGNPDLAYEYLDEARNHISEIPVWTQARLLFAFGTYFSQRKQLDSAAYYYEKGRALHKENGDLRGVAHGFNNLAIVAYQQGDIDKSIIGFEAALEVRLQLGNQSNISDSYYNIGLLYAGIDKHQEALRNFREGLRVALKLESVVSQRDICLEMAASFRKLNQFDSAYIYLSNWRILNDSFLVKNKQDEILELEKRFETDRIRKDQDLAEKETELRTYQRNVLLIGIIAVAIVSVIIFYISRLRYQRNMAISEKDKLQAQSRSELTMRELELKKEEIANYTNQLIHKNQILEELKSRLDEHQSIEDKISTLDYGQIAESIAPHLHEEKDWLRFKLQFEKAYPDFFAKLLTYGSDLSSYDQRLASLIKVNLSNKEISQVLHISTDSVTKAKYRLRQKLGLDTSTQLESLIHKI